MPTWSSARPAISIARLIFEPGRLIVGNAGILVTRVLFVKHGEAKNFVIVDAAMNDLIRPTLYEAHHEIWPVRGAGRRRAASAPTWSGRSARPATSSRSTATCRSPRPGDLLGRDVGRRLWRGAGRHLQHPRLWCRKCWSRARNGRWCARALKLTN